MKQKNSFQKVLDKAENRIQLMSEQAKSVRFLYNSGLIDEAYEKAMQLEESSEKLVLLTRALPAYTGKPQASMEISNVIRSCVHVEIGFTSEGWFSVRIPTLLPKKSTGSADYVRSFLYPAMNDFFKTAPPVRYTDCDLIYRHVYDEARNERQRRDHDNIEINMVSDIIALYVMPDDGPSICSHYYCSTKGKDERTEIYVVPKKDFSVWLALEKTMPDLGVKLYETPFLSRKKQV